MNKQKGLVLLVALASGFFYAAWRADLRLSEQLPPLWEGRDVSRVGRVLDLPEAIPNGVRFLFAAEAVHTPGASLPRRIQLGWYGRPGEPVPRIRGGESNRQRDGCFAVQIDIDLAFVVVRAANHHKGKIGFAQEFHALVFLLNTHQQHAVGQAGVYNLSQIVEVDLRRGQR